MAATVIGRHRALGSPSRTSMQRPHPWHPIATRVPNTLNPSNTPIRLHTCTLVGQMFPRPRGVLLFGGQKIRPYFLPSFSFFSGVQLFGNLLSPAGGALLEVHEPVVYTCLQWGGGYALT